MSRNMKTGLIFLFIIIVLGLILRTYHLLDRDLTKHDEGFYLVGTMNFKLKPLFSLPSCSAKPGHICLISLASLFIGLEGYTSLVVSAFFGILNIFLIYILGRDLYNRETGLWAAFIIAISPFHLYYSRSGYSFTSALFFYLLGIYLYYMSHVRKTHKLSMLFISGFSIGFAIACHHTFFWLWAVLPIYELFLAREKIKRVSILIFSLFLPAIIFEILVRITNFINPGRANDGFAYLPQLRRIFARYIPAVAEFDPSRNSDFSFFSINPSAAISYLRFFWRLEGPLICILFILGIIIILNRLYKKFLLNNFIILTQALIPTFIWFGHALFCNAIRVKALFVILAGIALITSQVIVKLKELIAMKTRSGFAVKFFSSILIVFFIITPLVKGIKEVLCIRYPFRQVTFELMEYLQNTSPPIGINYSTYPIWHFYFRRANIGNFYSYRTGQPVREGLFIIDEGTRRTLNQKIIWRSREFSIRKFAAILENTTPIISLPYLRDDFLERVLKPESEQNKVLEYFKVYDLRKLNYGEMG